MNTISLISRSRGARPHSIKPSVTHPEPFSVMKSSKKEQAGYFSALVHEVRNPLCNINLASGMLNLSNLDDEQRECLHIIMRGSERINDLINTLLRFDEVEAVKYELYSLQQLLEDVLIAAKDRLSLKQIEVSREYATPAHVISMDIERMKIALINIVNNAIDAMPSKRGKLKVVTSSAGQLSSIEIQDNGIGISKENLKRIFEPYFTKKPGGMGLGLTATLDILRANRASVDVRAEEGVGTCFTLSFDRR
jgi:signal transduction histidine kinase